MKLKHLMHKGKTRKKKEKNVFEYVNHDFEGKLGCAMMKNININTCSRRRTYLNFVLARKETVVASFSFHILFA